MKNYSRLSKSFLPYHHIFKGDCFYLIEGVSRNKATAEAEWATFYTVNPLNSFNLYLFRDRAGGEKYWLDPYLVIILY